MLSILVVDDSDQARDSITRTLEKSGYNIVGATNGQAALDKVKTGQRFDLILTDLNMPIMNGLEMCKQIYELNLEPKQLILVISSDINQEVKAELKNYNVVGTLIKPINHTTLPLILSKIFEKYRANRNDGKKQ